MISRVSLALWLNVGAAKKEKQHTQKQRLWVNLTERKGWRDEAEGAIKRWLRA